MLAENASKEDKHDGYDSGYNQDLFPFEPFNKLFTIDKETGNNNDYQDEKQPEVIQVHNAVNKGEMGYSCVSGSVNRRWSKNKK